MYKIFLKPPRVHQQQVLFEWSVEPASKLYSQTSFTVAFPDIVDLTRVPKRLWWDIFLLCLHSHWLLLRPCEIHLSLRLGEPLRQFWLKLLRNGLDTLEAYASPKRSEDLEIAIVDGDVIVPYEAVTGTGCATAFSGGKDSLLQAALLLELTDRPLLVATTSPMPPLKDHVTARRMALFDQMKTRRNPVFVEAVSDFRSNWDNSFAAQKGYHISVNELTDTFLYTSALAAAGAALGYARLFVASEAELQENALVDGKIVQHSHFMYTAATQRSVERLLGPYGLKLGSLTWPLHTMQIQQLLWTRYPDLADLQYSCWRVGEGEATCSQCEQCLRIAMTALASGHDPQRMGIDLPKVISFSSRWRPIEVRFSKLNLPQDEAADILASRVVEAIRGISLRHLYRVLRSDPKVSSAACFGALVRFIWLRLRTLGIPKPPPMGIREAYAEWMDLDLREPLLAIYKSQFSSESLNDYLGHFDRSRALTQRVASCLD